MNRSFSEEWDRWYEVNGRRDRATAERLKSAYRQAWETGDAITRGDVLAFIHFEQLAEGADLVVAGIRDEDAVNAQFAVGVAASLLMHGLDLGPNIRRLLTEYGERSEEHAMLSKHALHFLDKQRGSR